MAWRRLVALMASALIWNATGGPAAGAVPDPRRIALVDQRGAVFTLASLAGEPVILTFISTRCTDACPFADAAFAHLQAIVVAQRLHVRLVTLTLDPRYDRPFVMARLAHALGARSATWRLGSGAVGDLHALAAAFGVVAQPDRHGVPEAHSTYVYVLDRTGRLARIVPLSADLGPIAAAALQ